MHASAVDFWANPIVYIYVSSSTENIVKCAEDSIVWHTKCKSNKMKKIGSAPKKLSSFHFAFEFLLFFFFHTISLVCSHSRCSSCRKGLLCVGFICAKFGEGFTKKSATSVRSFYLFFYCFVYILIPWPMIGRKYMSTECLCWFIIIIIDWINMTTNTTTTTTFHVFEEKGQYLFDSGFAWKKNAIFIHRHKIFMQSVASIPKTHTTFAFSFWNMKLVILFPIRGWIWMAHGIVLRNFWTHTKETVMLYTK